MNDLDRLEKAMASKRLNRDDWEEFVCDALLDKYPGLNRLPGGTDHGRDADIVEPRRTVAKRLLVTSSRSFAGVKANMLSGIASMEKHDVKFDRIVLGNCALLNNLSRIKLQKAASDKGAVLDTAEIFDRAHFTSWLRRSGAWRERLLDLSATPISLSRYPTSLAEQPWINLPLVGRSVEAKQFSNTSGDLIVSGLPGVGKSRFVYDAVSNDDAVFVEADYEANRIASDLREATPAWVVVDDAERAESLIRQLQSWRRQESDVFSFRLVAICWSNDVDEVRSWMPSATRMSVDLLERTPMDQVVVSTGVTSEIARAAILDQSEGRPGWALSLCGTLKQSQSGTEILNGKALYGNVEPYLRRSGAQDQTADVLAAIAMAGRVTQDDVSELADVLSLSLRDVVGRINTAARGGLIDVGRTFDHDDRELQTYQVRPAMVADVLIAEQVFGNQTAVIDPQPWATKYPNRIGGIALAACRSVALGAQNATGTARSMTREALATDLQWPSVHVLLDEYALVGRHEAEEVVAWLEKQLAELSTDDFENHDGLWRAYSRLDKLSSVAAHVVRRWALPGAIEFLFMAGVIDNRTQHNNTEHSLRQIKDIAESFHPELPTSTDLRLAIAKSLASWVEDDRWGDARWEVCASVAASVLSVRRSAVYGHPGNINAFQMFETVLEPSEMDEVVNEIWPLLRVHVRRVPVLREVVNTIVVWLRAGSGNDAPFGQPHTPQQIKRAKSLGAKLLRDVAEVDDLSPGQRALLVDVAGRFRLKLDQAIAEPLVSFLVRPIHSGDWQKNRDHRRKRVESAVATWVNDDPATVVQKLKEIRAEIVLSGLPDDTIATACEYLARHVDDPATWLRVSIEHELAQGAAFLELALDHEQVTPEMMTMTLNDSGMHDRCIHTALSRPSLSSDLLNSVLSSLTGSDQQSLQWLLLGDGLPDEQIVDWLTRLSGSGRGALAAAVFYGKQRDTEWVPSISLRSAWLAALVHFRPGTGNVNEYEATELFAYLAHEFPQALVELVAVAIDEVDADEVSDVFPYSVWRVLRELPSADKIALWRRCESVRRHLQHHLFPDDMTSIEILLDSGELTTSDVMAISSGFGGPRAYASLAKLLIPRGIDPDAIASLAHRGSWTGNESDRYDGIVQQFASYCDSDDPSVAMLGRAGVRMFEQARDKALGQERVERIRGIRS